MPLKAGEMETTHLMFTIIAFLLLGLLADVRSDKCAFRFVTEERQSPATNNELVDPANTKYVMPKKFILQRICPNETESVFSGWLAAPHSDGNKKEDADLKKRNVRGGFWGTSRRRTSSSWGGSRRRASSGWGGNRRRTSSGLRRRTISTFRRRTISTFRRRTISAFRRRTISTFRRRTISTIRRRTISTIRRRTISTIRRRTISTIRRRTISTIRRRTISTIRRRTISTIRRRTISTIRRRTISTIRRRTISTIRRRTISTIRRRTISTIRRRTIATIRRRTISTIRRRTLFVSSRRRSSKIPKPVPEDYLKVGKSRQHLFDSEGLENPGGRFHSRVPHLPPGASGVTIGRGYDMKSRSKQSVIRDLKNTGMSESDAKRLAEGVGLTGQAAKKFIKDLGKFEITKQQQRKLFDKTYSEQQNEAKRLSSKYFKTNWDSLNPKIQEVLTDLKYRGDFLPTSTSAAQQKLKEAVQKNDLSKMKEVLKDGYWKKRGVTQNRIDSRLKILDDK